MNRDPITISLAQKPQGKGRPRFTRSGHAYTPDKTRAYEQAIRNAAFVEMNGKPLFEGAVRLQLRAVFEPPKSASRATRELMLLNTTRPMGKPDVDNIVKAWGDALEGVVFYNDTQIVQIVAEKCYGPEALVVATVTAI